ncbi:MAG: gas vesicle protein, partial [Cyanobacteria bacterium NC_groundwater_1444_Ag_S-0.65um_54_12]|nr:gas vesicle protein [Cyanobacteria bacterium NC_groundwater_1444_Ag_S-0.65um_54_12]
MQVQPGQNKATLVDVIDRILDKGLVLNADIQVTLCGVELLGIRIRAVLASFETAAKYGLEFPFGTQLAPAIAADAAKARESCPECGKRGLVEKLLSTGCPWCGW